MTISHQTVLDKDGNPSAVIIPWDEFRMIKEELERVEEAPLSPEWKAELDSRMRGIKEGTTEGIPNDKVMKNVRDRLKHLRGDANQQA